MLQQVDKEQASATTFENAFEGLRDRIHLFSTDIGNALEGAEAALPRLFENNENKIKELRVKRGA